MKRTSLALALLGSLLALPLAAATHPNLARGFDPNKAYQVGDLDKVNLFNGNMALTVPIGQRFQGNGNLSYGLSLIYNSKVWDWEIWQPIGTHGYRSARADRMSNAGFGWRLSLGELRAPLTPYENESPGWVYFGIDGAQYAFGDSLTGSNICAENTVYCYTRGTTSLRLTRIDAVTRRLEFPDGTAHTFVKPAGANYRLTSIKDVYGNQLAVDYGEANVWKLNETAAGGAAVRSHRIEFNPAQDYDGRQIKMVSKVKLAAFGGAVATYSFNYTQAAIPRPVLHDPLTGLPNPLSLPLLTEVVQPDGSSYQMPAVSAYQTTYVPGNGDIPGILVRLGLPTGGALGWTFGRWSFPTGESYNPQVLPREQPDFITHSSGVRSRTVYDLGGAALGTWSYNPFLDDPPGVAQMPIQKRTEVIDPAGNKTVNYFSVYLDNSLIPPQFATGAYYGLPFTVLQNDGSARRRFLSREVFAAGSTTALRRHWVAYDFEAGGSSPEGASSRRLVSERTDYVDDGTFKTIDLEDFDGLGHFRRTLISGNFVAGGPAENDRVEYVRYNPGAGSYPTGFISPPTGQPWILGNYSEKIQTERGETSRQEFCFESATGFLLKERQLRTGSARTAADVLRVYGRDAAGNRTSEKLFGGDQQALDANAATPLCTMTLPGTAATEIVSTFSFGSLASRQYAGTSHYLERRDIDAATGLPSKTYDVAGLDTTLAFDTLGRLAWIKPNAAHDGWQQYEYTRAVTTAPVAKAKVHHLRYGSGSAGTLLAEEQFHYDGLGRLALEYRKSGGATAWSIRERSYTPQGWLSQQTTWTTNPATAGKAIYSGFDPFGRPKYVDPPEGTQHRIEYFYGGERRIARQYKVGYARNANGSIAERKAGISETYDVIGRLRGVEEGSIDNNAADLIAEYTYNVDGRLAKARLSPRGGGSSQTRTFTWDQRGFLLAEEEPESGKWLYSGFDATGNYGRKNHLSGLRDLGYEYDAADRLVRVKDKLNGDRVLQEWTFATTNAVGNWKLGRVETARRYNYPRIPWSPAATATVEVKETWTYGGRGGRPSARRTEVPAFGRYFDQGWTYDPLGNVATLTYPRCGFANCTATPPVARTITNQYSQGVLVGVANWATLTYHDNGMVGQVLHQNGMIDTYDRDPSGLARVYNVRVQHPGRPPAQLGWHEYDGMGNLVRRRIDSSAAALDGLVADPAPVEGAEEDPLEEANAAPPAVAENFYLYDDFGRLKHFSDGSTRYQAYSYDPYSNLTAVADWNGSALLTRSIPAATATNRLTSSSYDALGNLTSRPLGSSSEIFEYGALGEVVSRNFPAETHLYTADGERLYSLFYQAGVPVKEEYTIRDLDAKALTLYERSDAATPSGEVWAWKKDYVYRDGSLLGLASAEPRTSNRNEQHFSLDHVGTPRVTSDRLGSHPALAIHHYWGFGEEYWSGLPDPEKMRFAGQERSFGVAGVADDLDYLHARYYSSYLGRFQSPDPRSVVRLQAAGSDRGSDFFAVLGRPHGWNRYAYANGNPLLNVDPDGEAAAALAATPLLFAEGGGAAIGAGASTIALPVTATLAGGALVGTAINQIPGVKESVSGALFNVFFASKANDAREFIATKATTVYEHITKYGAPDPNDPDDKSRKKNIGDRMLKHLEQAKAELKHLKGNSREAAEKTIQLAEDALKKWMSGQNVPK